MCRMMAVIPKGRSKLDSAFVRSFRNLAFLGKVPPSSKPGHGDGWGIVTWLNGVPTYLGREPTDAFSDTAYERACDNIDSLHPSTPVIVHLRKASVGLKIKENTHPFIIREWAFAHNGTIRKLNLKSKTDSQWFFEFLMRKYVNGRYMTQIIAEALSAVKGVYPYTSLTFILSNGKELYAYRDCTKLENYYEMFFTETKDALVICQEKIFESDWKEMQVGELLHVKEDSSYEKIELYHPIPLATKLSR